MPASDLCTLPPDAACGCCGALPSIPAAPLLPSNPPGLSAIRYRIGTFTSFRQAMLDQTRHVDLLGGLGFASLPDLLPNPFANSSWHPEIPGDYHTALIELWAYLADILTFYQERIANEAYLGTATQMDSLFRLAALIGYAPAPGTGAAGLLAFTVQKGKTISIPAGFRAGSRPSPGAPPVVFETQAAINAVGDHSSIPLSLTETYDPFGPLSLDPAAPVRGTPYRRSVVLQGSHLGLSVGDCLLLVENAGQRGEAPHMRLVTALEADVSADTTTVTWSESAARHARGYSRPALFAFRVKAGLFGSSAPAWNTLPKTLTGTVRGVHGPYENRDWDTHRGGWSKVPSPGDRAAGLTNTLFLDGIYDAIHAPDWIVVIGGSFERLRRALRITESLPVSRAAYTISAKTTRLTLERDLVRQVSESFPLRTTVVLAGTRPLTVLTERAAADSVSGDTLVLAGLYPGLLPGQAAVVSGNAYDTSAVPPSSQHRAERVALQTVTLDRASGTTTIVLAAALTGVYLRSSVRVMANIAPATQGETVRQEILGSGNGAAFQSFTLRKKPLTYLAASDAEGLTSTQSTLRVLVGGTTWTEQPSLVGGARDAQVYVVSRDESGQSTVQFGDGLNGAPPPSGRDNITARYRVGLGAAGNVDAGVISKLIDSIPGVQALTNPQPTLGGSDPDTLEQIRVNAPAGLLTFDRAVSVEDYATLALTYPGVSKAGSAWVLWEANADGTLRAVPRPYIQLTVAVGDGTVAVSEQGDFAHGLRRFLDARRDPNLPLHIVDHGKVPLEVRAVIDVRDGCGRAATLAAAQAALNPGVNPDGTSGFFAFGSLDFGQSIHLSAVYAALQAVPGVSSATIETLRRVDDPQSPAGTVSEHIFLRPVEMAVIDSTVNQKSVLVITLGAGGFDDT